jgi:dipeptidyl-peptidase-4
MPKDMLMWLHFMAQQGYIVACVDNRGVGNQSLKNNTSIYGKLGTNEVEDQALLANYMIQNYNIDTSNVSIWGWSYGGYLAIKCLLDSTTIFKRL